MVWVWWTCAEGLTRTATKGLLKVMGLAETSGAAFVLATAIIGVVQLVTGFFGSIFRKKAFAENQTYVIGSIAFGVLAYIVTVLSFLVFHLGGDMGVNTFITTLAIIPGGIIGSIVFRDKLYPRQWFAMTLAIVAGYLVIGRPSLAEFFELPLWIWLSFITMFGIGINQAIVQYIRGVDPMVQNFWVGLTQTVLCVGTIAVMGGWSVFAADAPPVSFWALAALIGVINVAMLVFNIVSYKLGASIALKKLVMNGVHLSTAMIAGITLFNEAANVEKFAGVLLYLVAYAVWDSDTWRSFGLKT